MHKTIMPKSQPKPPNIMLESLGKTSSNNPLSFQKMGFQNVFDLEKRHRQSQFLMYGIMLFCLFTTAGFVFFAMQEITKSQDRIYILNGGETMMARTASVKENRLVEAKDHVLKFNEYFFDNSPDFEQIRSNVEGRALYMADKGAEALYKRFMESGYYRDIIAQNIVQYLITDSVKVNMQVYPHEALYYGKQYQSRASQRVIRAFKSKCLLERASRSEHNPHGFIITNYELLENPIIKN
jgi:conjugative transposon TraK protein